MVSLLPELRCPGVFLNDCAKWLFCCQETTLYVSCWSGTKSSKCTRLRFM